MEISNTTKTVYEAVEEYMALAGDFNTMHKATFLLRGKWVWKSIRNNIFRETSNKWVSVDKTKLPYRVTLPPCASMFLTVSVKDTNCTCTALSPNNDMCIVDYEDVGKYDCQCKKEIENCITTSETTTEIINISISPFEIVPYTKTITTTISSNGNVYKLINEPIEELNSEGHFVRVTMKESKELICALSTKKCGCIEISQSNCDVIKSCCNNITINGVNEICNKKIVDNKPFTVTNKVGYFKYDGKETIYLEGNIGSQVLISFITKGEAEEDEVIPDYAMQYFFDKLDEVNSKYSQTLDRFARREKITIANISKKELEALLPRNHINILDWYNSTNKIGKW